MNTAEQYFQKQLAIPDFKQFYLEEKVKLDIEYQLKELEEDIQSGKPVEELINAVNRIEQYVMSV